MHMRQKKEKAKKEKKTYGGKGGCPAVIESGLRLLNMGYVMEGRPPYFQNP